MYAINQKYIDYGHDSTSTPTVYTNYNSKITCEYLEYDRQSIDKVPIRNFFVVKKWNNMRYFFSPLPPHCKSFT